MKRKEEETELEGSPETFDKGLMKRMQEEALQKSITLDQKIELMQKEVTVIEQKFKDKGKFSSGVNLSHRYSQVAQNYIDQITHGMNSNSI